MSSESEKKRTSDSLSMWQAASASFSGDANAVQKKRLEMTRENERQAELDALKKRKQGL